MPLRKIAILSPSKVWVEGFPEFIALDALLAQKPTTDELLVAIVPETVGKVAGTARTLQSALVHQYPGENTFATVPLSGPFHQAYVASESVLAPLRQLGRRVRVIPYPVALVSLVQGPRQKRSLVERTQTFLRGANGSSATPEDMARHRVVVETLGDEFLLLAAMGLEVVSVRHARGNVANEVLRTFAAMRMEEPVVYCTDETVLAELEAQGLDVEFLPPSGPVAAAAVLEKFAGNEFLSSRQLDAKRQAESKKSARQWFVVASVLLLTALGASFSLSKKQDEARALSLEKAQQKQAELDALAVLYAQKYGDVARRQSLLIQNELFDLLTVLPPQVVMVSVSKDANGLLALLERRSQSAPFDTEDLRFALSASTHFARAEISETYDGHLIRYSLKVPPAVSH